MSTSQSAKKSTRKKPAAPHRSQTPELRAAPSLAQLLSAFLRLIRHPDVHAALMHTSLTFYDRLFSVWVCLWLFVLQRLKTDTSLEGLVADVHHGLADRVAAQKASCPPLSLRLRSTATPSLSDARQRLPQPLLSAALAAQAKEIWTQAQDLAWHGLRVILLDGSTVRLRPYGNVPQHYPAHARGQPGYWCLMRVVVGFCWHSGAAVATAFGSKYLSEQTLACSLLMESLPASLYLGDRNFGVFRIVQTAVHAQVQVLVRLTDVRARKVLGKKRLVPGDYPISWVPSPNDTLQDLCSASPVAGRLIVVWLRRPGFRSKRLCLFTTLQDAQVYRLEQLVELYGQRWQVEINLRYLKTQMGLHLLQCKSAAMNQKEWLAGLLAYNLIRSVMVAAAAHHQISVYALSFSSARRWVLDFVRHLGMCLPHLPLRWEKLLATVSRCRLPKRRLPRPNEPRRQRLVCKKFPILRGSRAAARKQLNPTGTPKPTPKS
jgi:hypothetical protein